MAWHTFKRTRFLGSVNLKYCTEESLFRNLIELVGKLFSNHKKVTSQAYKFLFMYKKAFPRTNFHLINLKLIRFKVMKNRFLY